MARFRARYAKLFLTIAATTAIAACGGGGGGGDDGDSVDTSSAQGVYEGQLGANTTGQYAAIVLENGESWALYSFTSASGFLHARGTSSNGSYSASDVLDYGTAPPAAGSVQASYNASAGTLQGQYAFGTLVVPFSASRPAQGYQYNTPADPSTITGKWSFVSSADQSMQLQVAADGSLTASGATGCTMTGSLTPRPSGKNVFNAALRFGSACAQPGLVAAGVAIVIVENGERALILMGASSDRTVGTVAVGTRTPI